MRLSWVTTIRWRARSARMTAHATATIHSAYRPARSSAPGAAPDSEVGSPFVPVSATTATFIRVLVGIGSAAVVLPALAVVGDGGVGALSTAVPGVAVAVLSAALVLRVRHRPPSLLGGVIVALASWLLSQARPGAIDWFLAALLGLGVALAWPAPDRRPRLDDPALLLGFAGTVATLVGVAAGAGPDSAWAWGSLTGIALVVADGVLRRDSEPDPDQRGWLVPVAGLAAVLLLGA